MSSRQAPSDPAPLRTLKLTIAYDGGGFAGSQVQPGQRTVQDEVERAIAKLFGDEARATFAGRTDRGVHAAGQVVGVEDGRPDLHSRTMVRALNALLPEDISVIRAERAEGRFHARFDATWREYRYRIWSGIPSPLGRNVVWRIGHRLDGAAMARAAGDLIGEHDFAAFASGGEGVPWADRQQAPRGTRRRVFSARIVQVEPWWGANRDQGTLFEVRIVADAYLPSMVRNIVGVLVEIGRGARSQEWVAELLAIRDRRQAGITAPAHGLILWRVGYGAEPPPTE